MGCHCRAIRSGRAAETFRYVTIPELLEWAKGLGTAAGPIFALLWWLERGERKDTQDELKKIAKDAAIGITAMEKTIAQWATIFNSTGKHDQ